MARDDRPFVFFRDSEYEAAVGDVVVRAPPGSRRVSLASDVLSRGVVALGAATEATTRRFVLAPSPPLDDLLAAEIAWRQGRGEGQPQGLRVFAEYAALLREGISPTTLDPERSLEALYAAIAHAPEFDGEALLRDWTRLAQALWEAAAAGVDPLKERVFDDSDFPREVAFLRNDHHVFARDVANGERWRIRLPERQEEASALVLRRPRSVLFKVWARADPEAPGGRGYSVLVVSWGGGSWVVTVNPTDRISLRFLADALQRAESSVASEAALTDPWFDGARFEHTLVAAPKSGTRLGDAVVLGLLRKELSAQEIRERRRLSPVWIGAAAVAVAGTAITGLLLSGRSNQPAAPGPAAFAMAPSPAHLEDPDDTELRARGSLSADEVAALKSTELAGEAAFGFVACFGYESVPERRLRAACPGAARIYRVLTEHYGLVPGHVWFATDEPERLRQELAGTKYEVGNVIVGTGRDAFFRALDQVGKATTLYRQGNPAQRVRRLVFYYGGHGERVKQKSDVGYLALPDWYSTKGNNPESAGVEMGDLMSKIEDRADVTHTILLLDSCFSGLVTRSGEAPRKDVARDWGSRAQSVITASGRDQVAFESGTKSFFAETIIQGLTARSGKTAADANGDGVVTEGELAQFVQGNITGHCPSRQPDCQKLTPVYRQWEQKQGQFLFVPE